MHEETYFGRIRVYRVTGRAGMRRFRALARRIYQDDPNWTPPLKRDEKSFLNVEENPFFERAESAFFLAERNGKVLGRVAAIHNYRHEEFHRDQVGFFGLFECENDAECAQALLQIARRWLTRRGLKRIRGPMNFSMNDDFGCVLSVDGVPTKPARPLQPYNPPYYRELFRRAGFEPVRDCIAMSWDRKDDLLRNPLVPRKVQVRPIRDQNFRELLTDLKAINALYHEVWNQNWGFLPTSDAEQEFAARRLQSILDPNLMLLAEVHGELVGMILAIPDYYVLLRALAGKAYPWLMPKAVRTFRQDHTAVMIAFGIKASFRESGLADYLLNEIHVRNPKFSSFETNWILEENRRVQHLLASRCGARPIKRFRVFERTV